MWFRKKQSAKAVPYTGLKQAVDGHSVLAAVEQRLSDAIAVPDSHYFADLVVRLGRKDPDAKHQLTIRRTSQPHELASITAGAALTGMRTAAITDRLSGLGEELHAMSAGRLACIIHLTARALARQAGAMHGGHDEYHNMAGAGFFQMFAGSAQEVADFTVIAHRIAELSLIPGICAQDIYQTSHSVQIIRQPESELIQKFLGEPGDLITCPTPSQTLLFGARRRRIPILLDRDHPAAIGVSQDRESFFRALAAQRPFFYSHLHAITEQVLAEYAELTGRSYAPVAGYRADDAEILIIAQGTICEELQATVDFLREHSGIRAGVIKLNMLRPFPGAQLSHLLYGKKAVTVLERTDQPLAEDLPLMREVRSALDKSMENGRQGGRRQPWPDYKSYQRDGDRPVLYSGVYGVGSYLPGVADLAAVFRNMINGNLDRKCFYVGRLFAEPDRRFPQLQTLHQWLHREYPVLQQLSVHAGADRPKPSMSCAAADFQYLSSQGGIFAVNLFARSIAEMVPGVRTFPRGGLEQNLHPVSIILAYSRDESAITGRPADHDMVFVTSWRLVENPAMLESIRPGGSLVIASNRTPMALRQDLSRRIQKAIRDRSIRVAVVNAGRIAAETASNPSFVDQLTVWALLGIYMELNPDWSEADRQAISQQLSLQLGSYIDGGSPRTDEISRTMARAPAELIDLPQEFWEYHAKAEVGEPEPPWTVNQSVPGDHSVYDAARFWHSVGYLYDSGQSDQMLGDPYLATGIVPAASSAFRDITPYRLKLPEWLPENCTGCGICWAACPETALPPVVLNLPVIIQGVISRCEAAGATFIQLKRVQDALAKQAYRLIVKDEQGQYLYIGKLLQDAFDQIVEQMQLAGEKLDVMAGEFNQIYMRLEHFKLARTEPFFTGPHAKEKNSGMVLGITLNPMTCTGCGVCIDACPEGAFELAEQTPERLDALKRNWQLQLDLPLPEPARIDALIAADRAETQAYRLLDRKAYHAMLGGDGTRTGNGAKTALHLLTATAESIMRTRFEQHSEKLQRWITELETVIQGDVTRSLSINDFDDFTRRLSQLDGSNITLDNLLNLVSDRRGSTTIDQAKLRRQSDLLARLKLQLHLYRQGLDGSGRARMFLVVDPVAASSWNETYPYNPHTQPWVCYPAGSVTGLADGIATGIRRVLMDDMRTCRQAEKEISGTYTYAEQDLITGGLEPDSLTATEKLMVPPVFVICPDVDLYEYATSLASGAYPLKLVVINQQGLVRSAADGSFYFRELPDVLQKQGMIIQASIGHPGDLIQGIAAMIEHDGPVLLHIYAPDPGTSGIAQEQIIAHAALAYRSRAFPLFRIKTQDKEAGILLAENQEPDCDWPGRELTVRDHSGQESTLITRMTAADWAIRELRFRQQFEVLPRGHLNKDEMKPLTDYLELEPGQRESYRPYIDYVNDRQQQFIAIVSPAMVEVCTAARDNWRRVQAQANRKKAPASVTPQQAAAGTDAPDQARVVQDQSAQQKLTESLLQLCGYSQDPEFFKQSLREFLVGENQATEQQPEATD